MKLFQWTGTGLLLVDEIFGPIHFSLALSVISSRELKAQVSFSDHLSSVCLSLNFSHFYLLLTKLETKQSLVIGFKFVPMPFSKGR